jgi:hypothetical protein
MSATITQIDEPEKPIDPAFREHASGLIVPAAISREREVWSRDEWKTLDRAAAFLERRGVAFLLACDRPDCRKQGALERVRRDDGGLTLRCAHKDREIHKL